MVSLTPPIELSRPARPYSPIQAGPPPNKTERGLGVPRTVAIVVGGVGIVSLGIGTAIGVVALSNKSSALSLCPGNVCPSEADANSVASANSTGNVAAIFLIAGGAAVVGGAVLWLTAPRPNRTPSTQLGFGPGSVQVLGSW